MAANGVDLATLDQLIEQRKKLIAQQAKDKAESTPSKRGQKKAEKRALESAMEGTEPKGDSGGYLIKSTLFFPRTQYPECSLKTE